MKERGFERRRGVEGEKDTLSQYLKFLKSSECRNKLLNDSCLCRRTHIYFQSECSSDSPACSLTLHALDALSCCLATKTRNQPAKHPKAHPGTPQPLQSPPPSSSLPPAPPLPPPPPLPGSSQVSTLPRSPPLRTNLTVQITDN